jgi:hypothetical protein
MEPLNQTSTTLAYRKEFAFNLRKGRAWSEVGKRATVQTAQTRAISHTISAKEVIKVSLRQPKRRKLGIKRRTDDSEKPDRRGTATEQFVSKVMDVWVVCVYADNPCSTRSTTLVNF